MPLPRPMLYLVVSLALAPVGKLATAQTGCTPPNQPQGVNNTLLVTAASQDIDDKSPMAAEVSPTVNANFKYGQFFMPDNVVSHIPNLNVVLQFIRHSANSTLPGITANFTTTGAATLPLMNVNRDIKRLLAPERPAVPNAPAGLSPQVETNAASLFLSKQSIQVLNTNIEYNDVLQELSNDEQSVLNTQFHPSNPPKSDDAARARYFSMLKNYIILKHVFRKAAQKYISDNNLDAVLIKAATIAPDNYDDLSDLVDNVVKESLYVGEQTRSDKKSTLYAPEVIYSNGRLGFDVAAQGYLSQDSGEGLSGRYSLTPARLRLVRAALNYKHELIDAHKGKSTLAIVAAQLSNTVPKDESDAQTEVVDALAYYILVPHISVNIGYRSVIHVGTLLLDGVSVSWAQPMQRNRRYNGITFLVSGQYVNFDPERDTHLYTPRGGTALYWQDQISRRAFHDHGGDHPADIMRWETQCGIEFLPRNRIQPVDVYDVFVRQRIEPFSEVTISAGKDAASLGFMMVSLGHTFSW